MLRNHLTRSLLRSRLASKELQPPWTAFASKLQSHGSFAKEHRWNSTYFANESEYHSVADETLEDIQDVVEIAIEDEVELGENEPEVTYASGVLTMSFPPHGTWVLNKQTPNRQIWWSSPISGPRRYEYDGRDWVFTRAESGAANTLEGAMKKEFQEIYGVDLDL